MKRFATPLICACIALAGTTAFAQDAMKKGDPASGDAMMKKDMTLQECKDHMAMAKKDAMKKDTVKKDDAMTKQETMCADMMKKEGMTGEPMKKDGMAPEPMKK